MNGNQDPATEDRERLERFLEQRRAEGRERAALRRRWFRSVAVAASLGFVIGALVTWLTAGPRETRGPAATPIEPGRERPPVAAVRTPDVKPAAPQRSP
ncbi:MAG: hypothetical protein ACRD09_06780, partial [Vicinamibacterales bacterium]